MLKVSNNQQNPNQLNRLPGSVVANGKVQQQPTARMVNLEYQLVACTSSSNLVKDPLVNVSNVTAASSHLVTTADSCSNAANLAWNLAEEHSAKTTSRCE